MKGRNLENQCPNKGGNFDDVCDDEDRIRVNVVIAIRREGFDAVTEIDEAEGSHDRVQPEPENVQDAPGNISVSTLTENSELERRQEEEDETRDVGECRLLETDGEVRVVGVPSQVAVPQRIGAKRLFVHCTQNNFFSIFLSLYQNVMRVLTLLHLIFN